MRDFINKHLGIRSLIIVMFLSFFVFLLTGDAKDIALCIIGYIVLSAAEWYIIKVVDRYRTFKNGRRK